MKELFAALIKAQSEMGGAVRDSANPFFKSKYADLSSVMEAIRPSFAANSLGFIQVCHDVDNAVCVETIIIHASGESYSCGRVSVPVSKQDAQGFGSAITYAKRYSLQAGIGVPSVDDDGNGAAKAAPKIDVKKPDPVLIAPPVKTDSYAVTNERADELFTAAKSARDRWLASDADGAFDEISGVALNGEKLFLWAILKQYPALRAAIKSRWAPATTQPETTA